MLLVEGGRISDRGVLDLPGVLRPGDVLIFNDTRVIPAQLEGRRGEARVGATLHKREGPREWRAFIRNAKRVRDGDVIEFGQDVRASAVERDSEGAILLHFHGEEPLQQVLESVQGPVTKIIAVIIIIVTGLTLAFGETAGGFRRLIQIVFGLSIAFAASSFFLSFFSFGGGALVS